MYFLIHFIFCYSETRSFFFTIGMTFCSNFSSVEDLKLPPAIKTMERQLGALKKKLKRRVVNRPSVAFPDSASNLKRPCPNLLSFDDDAFSGKLNWDLLLYVHSCGCRMALNWNCFYDHQNTFFILTLLMKFEEKRHDERTFIDWSVSMS